MEAMRKKLEELQTAQEEPPAMKPKEGITPAVFTLMKGILIYDVDYSNFPNFKDVDQAKDDAEQAFHIMNDGFNIPEDNIA